MSTILTIAGFVVGFMVVLFVICVISESLNARQRPARYLPEMRFKCAMESDDHLLWGKERYERILSEDPRNWIAPLKLQAIRDEMRKRGLSA